MKRYTILVFNIIIILAVSSAVWAATALEKDMVALDKIYMAAAVQLPTRMTSICRKTP